MMKIFFEQVNKQDENEYDETRRTEIFKKVLPATTETYKNRKKSELSCNELT